MAPPSTVPGHRTAVRPPWAHVEHHQVGDQRVRAFVAGPGAGATVVAVHGLGCSHRYWARVAAVVGRQAPFVALDLPGFGGTPGPRPAPAVAAQGRLLGDWLATTGRVGAVVVANSAGCQVVASAAAQGPGTVGAVALVGPTLDPGAPGLLRQLGRLVADVPHERPDLWATQAGDYLRCGPRRLLETFRRLQHHPMEADVALVDAPVVVVRGRHDPVVSRGWADRLARAAVDGELVEVPGAGHAVHHRRPEAVAAVVEGLLDRATVRASSGPGAPGLRDPAGGGGPAPRRR